MKLPMLKSAINHLWQFITTKKYIFASEQVGKDRILQLLKPNVTQLNSTQRNSKAISVSTRKLDRGICLSRTKNCADYDSRGFEPATPVAGPATLRY